MLLNRLSHDVSDHERKNLYLLLAIGLLYTLGIFLSNIFVNIFLWKQSEDIQVVAFYNLFIAISQTLIYIVFGKWAKKIDRILILRAGITLISIFFISVLAFGENAAHYNLLLGSLLGAGYGFFWLAFNVLTFEVTEPYTRDFFNSTLGMLQSFSGMVGPITAGFIITVLTGYTGYLTIFFISFILFILAVVCSFFIERREIEGTYALRVAIKERQENANWKRLLNAHFFQGTREGVFLFLVGLLVYMGTQSEMTVGIYNFIYAATSLLAYQVVARVVTPSNRIKFITFGAISLYLAIFWLLISNLSYEFFIFGAIVGIAFPLFFAPYMSISYDVIGKANQAREYRIEYIILREIFLNLGRGTSLLLFLLGLLFMDQSLWIQYGIVIFGVGYLIVNIYLAKIVKDSSET
ncbi:YQGE family putative transporter [Alkalibacillus filiformis]|uniref:YQGE family putative transporter n=1 Tax=Alkalibacillus filiformis TaxID=200990 RepID=A0ABU0DRT1_9BACI|nr:MFS transporter [Alkalibacillus filiformis]MDQ0351028.1 YQGE family putative transporter [Alkalibacillus filiformis]